MTGLGTELPQLFSKFTPVSKGGYKYTFLFWLFFTCPANENKRENNIFVYFFAAASKLVLLLWKEFYLTFIWIIGFKFTWSCLHKSQYLRILGCNSTDGHCRMTMTLEAIRALSITVLTEKCWLRHVETMIKSLNGRLVFGVGGDTKSLSLHMHVHHRQHMWCTFAY